MSKVIDYKKIRSDYNAIKDNDYIYKDREYYASIDTNSGSRIDAYKIQDKIIDELIALDDRKELCVSLDVRVKANYHDFGTYYTVDLYYVALEVDDNASDELWGIVDDYSKAGRDQIEQILEKYNV